MALSTLVAVLFAAGFAGALPGVAAARPRGAQQTMPDLTAPGPDAVWFSEMRGYRDGRTESWIGRITPTGLVTEFRARLPYPASLGKTLGDPSLLDLAVAPDGRVWFVAGTPWIGRLAANGVVTRFPTRIAGPRGWGSADSITAGPDGNLWFTGGSAIGRITPRGAVTAFPLRPGEASTDITSGPDGNLWFVLSVQGPNGWVEHLAKITTSGAITAFAPMTPPLYVSVLADLTAGPDGNVWFTKRDQIGRITPDGRVRMFSPGLGGGDEVSSLTTGPDGNLWFTAFNEFRERDRPIGQMTPAGAVRFFRTAVEPFEITAGPDGNLWFTEPNLERIGRITPAGVVSEFPPAPRVSALRQRGPGGITARLRCPAAAPMVCRGTVTLEQGDGFSGPRRYGVTSFAVAPGAATTVRVPLWARGRRRLAAHGTLTLIAVTRPRSLRTKGLGGLTAKRIVLQLRRLPPVTG
jgi:streptogramin lyase